ncbi:MAG: undecaprenyl-phosphate glucose phosphotransferase [Acaryochloridaceae cyanobacterium RL_2_7]|nr:undecaprenyl-phosphate glucose phosphotransferase [Acaryochloridaceae cyanobacterium RL_2_7]
MPQRKKRSLLTQLYIQAHRIWSVQRFIDALLATLLLFVMTFYYESRVNLDYMALGCTTFILTPILLKMAGVYDNNNLDKSTSRFPKILTGWGCVSALLLFIGFFTQTSNNFSRLLISVWLLSVPVFIGISHQFVRYLLTQLQISGRNSRRAVIGGGSQLSQMLSEQIRATPELGIQLSGFFLDHTQREGEFVLKPALGDLTELPTYVRDHKIDVVYLALSMQQEESLAKVIRDLQDTTACVYVVPNITMFNLMQAKTYEINGIPLISVWEVPFSDIQYFIKRLIDIFVALVALILLGPVMIAICVGIKLTSPGPILFKQFRYGVNGQRIRVYKFRSMTVQENGSEVKQATKNDSRITKLGAFLRKSSLDELPQFINVLQGRMSIVGPRPHAVAHNEFYRKEIQGYMLRHLVKPGITGWAQVNGLRGETETLDKMQKRIEYDLQYLRKWSLWLDIVIILEPFLPF